MITPVQINDAVKTVEYHHFRGTTTMACCLVLHTGDSVVGIVDSQNILGFNLSAAQESARLEADRKAGALLEAMNQQIAH